MPIVRIRHCVAFLTFVLLNALAQTSPQVSGAIQSALNNQLNGKIITLREFHPGKELRFTADGHYQGKDEQGPWTLWSKLMVTAIEVGNEAVTIKGRRVHVGYNVKQGRFMNIESKQQAAIAIEFAGTPITSESVRTALERLFLGKEGHLSSFVPQEWQGVLKLEEAGSLQSLSAVGRKEKDKKLVRTLPAVTAPKVISAPDPEYQREARDAGWQGTVILSAFVNEDGRVSDVRISRPLGMGLDEKAIEAVRKWRFESAKKAGVPVKSQINIEVNFRVW